MHDKLEGLDEIGDALGLRAETIGAVAARRRRLVRYIVCARLPARFLGGRYYADRAELLAWWAALPGRAPARRRAAGA